MRLPTAPCRQMVTAAVLAPGFFGKVPARGDFLSRRFPATLLHEWEAWSAGLVVAARDALGPAWPEAWLTAPLWHFTLGRALAPPGGAAGVLVASADRVGRCYPFTIIGGAPAGTEHQAPRLDGSALNDWAAAAEALTLGALQDDFDADLLSAALAALGPPPMQHGPVEAIGTLPLALDGDWPADARQRMAAPAQSAWFCRGSDRVPPICLRCTGLPDRPTAAAMFTGDFASGA